MRVIAHDEMDRPRLEVLVRSEANAKQRDRYRAVLLAMGEGESDGAAEREGDEIAEMIGRSPRFVDEWVGRYRRGGLAALVPRKQPGRRPKLTPEQEAKLRARLDAAARDGPPVEDGVCTLRGKDVCRIIEQEFGVTHTLGGIYDVLRRLGYSSLVPRPRHRKNDPAAMAQFQQDAPLLPAP